MDSDIKILRPDAFPPLLREIDDPPDQLYLRGSLPPADHWLVCVVGSRKASTYGKHAVEHIIRGFRGLPVSIVSGLALGIDAEAHRAACNAGLHTIAVPGSGLDASVLYPKSHHTLAEDIITTGGCLASEFEPTFQATQWSFPKRNRIMAGMSHAVLIIEAGERSGTLITARLGLEYNREVMAVPGSIFADGSAGPHQLIRDGARPVTCGEDICEELGISTHSMPADMSADISGLTENERVLYDLLREPCTRDALIRASGLSVGEANVTITQMELKGVITEKGGSLWRI